MTNCVDRLCRTSNSVAHLVDFFCHSLYSFKRSANKAVNSSVVFYPILFACTLSWHYFILVLCVLFSCVYFYVLFLH